MRRRLRAGDAAGRIGVRGHVITAAIAVLADGSPRTAADICAQALAQGLVPAHTSAKYVYTALIEYIARTKGHERKPALVQDRDRRFRANHPPDPWPAPAQAPAGRAPTAAALAALARVRATATGAEPDAFEDAVCTLFEALGFVATHVGGYEAPDGYLDAPLGPLAYRVMLECKTGSANGFVTQPNVAEAAQYRATYDAAFCALVGPAFGAARVFAAELRTHGVSAWAVDDLAAVVHSGFDPAELRALFAPGLVADVVDDATWDTAHGVAKRVGAICDAIEAVAVRAQRAWYTASSEEPHSTSRSGISTTAHARICCGSSVTRQASSSIRHGSFFTLISVIRTRRIERSARSRMARRSATRSYRKLVLRTSAS